jgi:hypothetical protein
MDIFEKLKRHVLTFDPAQHWPLVKPYARVRFKHNGVQAHPVRHLMNHDLAERGQPLLLLHQHRVVQDCDHPICINPRHFHVEANRKLIGITPSGIRVYHEDHYPIPRFSWDPSEELLEFLDYELGKIPNWRKLPAEQLHAQLNEPDFTVEMIRRMQCTAATME